jgi:GT2 family glycosyltransferase
MKILIAIPCYNTILVPTIDSVIRLLRNDNYEADIKFKESIYVHNNRNALIEEAKGYTHIFFVDHDVIYNEDTLELLLKDDKDIISGLYNYRSLPPTPILFDKQGDEIFNKILIPKETFKCYAVPAGCLLIKMKVFEKLKKPYFNFKYTPDGQLAMSEDIYFCEQANKAGIDIWCNPKIKLSHIGAYYY